MGREEGNGGDIGEVGRKSGREESGGAKRERELLYMYMTDSYNEKLKTIQLLWVKTRGPWCRVWRFCAIIIFTGIGRKQAECDRLPGYEKMKELLVENF